MSKSTQKKATITPIIQAAPVVEVDDLDEMEQEIGEATKEVKTKKAKAPHEPVIGDGMIGVAGLAEQLGITGRELRMFLRKHFRDMTADKGKTYVWTKGSKEVQEITDAFKAYKAAPHKKTEKAEPATEDATTETVKPIDLDDIDLD